MKMKTSHNNEKQALCCYFCNVTPYQTIFCDDTFIHSFQPWDMSLIKEAFKHRLTASFDLNRYFSDLKGITVVSDIRYQQNCTC